MNKTMLVSPKLDNEAVMALENRGIRCLKVPLICSLDKRIQHHVDLGACVFFNKNCEKSIVACKEYESVLRNIEDVSYYIGSSPGSKYPEDTKYNVAIMGKYAIHRFDITDDVLKRRLEEASYEMININQGYAKCSISIISDKFAITQDAGIEKILSKKGIDVLYIKESKIILDGYSYGFIGGATGMIDSNTFFINGDINALESKNDIIDALSKRDISILCLSKEPPEDVGSFLGIGG